VSAARTIRRTFTALIAAAALAVPAAGVAGASPDTDPSAAPGEGTIAQSGPGTIALAGLDLPVTVRSVLYRSTDTHGDANEISGTVVVPDQPWTGDGPRPLVVLAPGTQGQGDQCAPSARLADGDGTDNLAQAALFLAQGHAVAITDYEGLGTPGMHTYANRLAQAHAVLDMGRAAKELGAADDRIDIAADAPVGLWGYSQGGGATGAAAELVDDYAPDLGVRGAYVGAPPADLAATTAHIDGSRLSGAIGYAINGLVAAYPELAAPIDAELNDAGRDMVAAVAQMCNAETVEHFGWRPSTEFTADGAPAERMLEREPFRSVLAAQRLGDRRPDVPVFVVTADNDDIVPADTVRTLAADWCARGGDVTFRDYPIPAADPQVDHAAAVPVSAPEAVPWLTDRLAGVPDTGECG